MLYQPYKIDYWKLGKNEHTKSLKRLVDPPLPKLVLRGGIIQRVRGLFFKWDVNTYPGYISIVASILGVERDWARKVGNGSGKLSAIGRARLLDWLYKQRAELDSIIADLEEDTLKSKSQRLANPLSDPKTRMEHARKKIRRETPRTPRP